MLRPVLLAIVFTALCAAALLHASHALTVHLVAHTHDDVGWLKNVDEYYVGSHNDIQQAAVQHILTSVVAALKRVPERKFVYVEQAFFQRWWRQQTEATRADVRRLVKGGQLEFANGGWAMHDEGTTHYIDMIDQTTLGHQFILTEFGSQYIPTVGWQIDPFGHSATQASLLSAEVGFDALYFGRIDYQDRIERRGNLSLEMIWSASASYGPSNYVFGSTPKDEGYGPPPGLCWDNFCGDEAINDDPALEDNNVDEVVERIVVAAYEQAAFTRGNVSEMNIMWQMGSDFNYENAEQFFMSAHNNTLHTNNDQHYCTARRIDRESDGDNPFTRAYHPLMTSANVALLPSVLRVSSTVIWIKLSKPSTQTAPSRCNTPPPHSTQRPRMQSPLCGPSRPALATTTSSPTHTVTTQPTTPTLTSPATSLHGQH